MTPKAKRMNTGARIIPVNEVTGTNIAILPTPSQ
jgi:hypothetical protein